MVIEALLEDLDEIMEVSESECYPDNPSSFSDEDDSLSEPEYCSPRLISAGTLVPRPQQTYVKRVMNIPADDPALAPVDDIFDSLALPGPAIRVGMTAEAQCVRQTCVRSITAADISARVFKDVSAFVNAGGKGVEVNTTDKALREYLDHLDTTVSAPYQASFAPSKNKDAPTIRSFEDYSLAVAWVCLCRIDAAHSAKHTFSDDAIAAVHSFAVKVVKAVCAPAEIGPGLFGLGSNQFRTSSYSNDTCNIFIIRMSWLFMALRMLAFMPQMPESEDILELTLPLVKKTIDIDPKLSSQKLYEKMFPAEVRDSDHDVKSIKSPDLMRLSREVRSELLQHIVRIARYSRKPQSVIPAIYRFWSSQLTLPAVELLPQIHKKKAIAQLTRTLIDKGSPIALCRCLVDTGLIHEQELMGKTGLVHVLLTYAAAGSKPVRIVATNTIALMPRPVALSSVLLCPASLAGVTVAVGWRVNGVKLPMSEKMAKAKVLIDLSDDERRKLCSILKRSKSWQVQQSLLRV
ncbi:hypothetical protein J8273_1450 [Carpediemonas membranifera]|uniref:Uncharacterized protein n=1 Tax=Carpediemonas membranifera TaxID=201153 RepID=A0A8J6B8J4_9EUKA|nr:hypothetical protein J8273_1450 [Carpediemonas membranifera]|eukprot:KAG9396469.1 hypothetical protein J8273_1450 [Carpediemonas membranifera]